MTLSEILKIVIVLEPMLATLDSSIIQPEIKKLIDGVQNPELKAFLSAVDGELDKLVKVELGVA